MAKFDWSKVNKKNRLKRQSEQNSKNWNEVKGSFEKATKAQKKLIREYKMFPSEMVNSLSKLAASKIISKYAEEHNWKKK